MQVTTKDGHIFVTADTGNYVGLADESVFGESLSLGIGLTAADCIEKPIGEWQLTLPEEPFANLIDQWPKPEIPEFPEEMEVQP